MDFWLEFVASSWGRSTGYPLLAGGFGGMAGIISGYPLDTLRIRQQQSISGSASASFAMSWAKKGLLLSTEAWVHHWPLSLFIASSHANALFSNCRMLWLPNLCCSRAFDSSISSAAPASFKSVALAGFGTGALQSLILSPIELVKIRLQLQSNSYIKLYQANPHTWPVSVAKSIFKAEGLKGMYRDRKSENEESLNTTLVAGVASWTKAQSLSSLPKYTGIIDCFRRSVREEGYRVLWRGLGNAVARAFLVSGAIFCSYEIALRSLFNNVSIPIENAI
ncbi:mitochondrial arginine transporter bac2 [Quercus suber]|uniref:Mitochondrial arginine transporter bac2 n=1 Tax=Quercus suber TaxID=58331 RepID=A0AAW0LV76_QUESU